MTRIGKIYTDFICAIRLICVIRVQFKLLLISFVDYKECNFPNTTE